MAHADSPTASLQIAALSQTVQELSDALQRQQAEVGALESRLKGVAEGQEGVGARVQRVEEEQKTQAGRVKAAETQVSGCLLPPLPTQWGSLTPSAVRRRRRRQVPRAACNR